MTVSYNFIQLFTSYINVWYLAGLIVVAWVKLIHNFSFTLDIQSRLIQIH
jgi:predicted metal-binding membrane protein